MSHSFIIDLEDRQIMRLFTIEEREEIKSKNIKDDPEPEDDVIACLSAFNKVLSVAWKNTLCPPINWPLPSSQTNVHDIREVMAQFSTRQGAEYTIQRDFSTDVIIYAIHSL